jgi:hypothetical protein
MGVGVEAEQARPVTAAECKACTGTDERPWCEQTQSEWCGVTNPELVKRTDGVSACVEFLPCSFCKIADACKVSGCVDAKIGRAIAAGERAAAAVQSSHGEVQQKDGGQSNG